MDEEKRNVNGVSLFEKAEYAAGGMFKTSTGGYIANMYWMFFLTNIVGLPTVLAATANTAVKFIKMVSMAFCGAIVDSTSFKMGRYRGWILIGDLGMMVLQGMLFWKMPTGMSNVTYVVLILVIYFLHITCYNVSWTSSRALVGVMATNTKDSVGLTAAANIGSTVAGIINGLVAIPLLDKLAHTGNQYMLVSYIFAIIYPIGSMIMLHVAKKYEIGTINENGKVTQKPKQEKVPFRDMLACLKGPGFWFCVSCTLMNCNGIQQVLLVYYVNYVLKNPAVTGIVTTTGSIAGFFAALISPWFCSKLGKKGVYIFSMFGGTIVYIAYYFIGSNSLMYIILRIIQTLITSPVGTAMVAMANDIADYNAMQGRKSAKAFAQSMMGVTIRIGGLVATALGSFSLVWIGYEKGTTPTDSMLKSIVLMMSLIPAAFYLLAGITILFYKIDEKEMEEYRLSLLK